MPFAACMSIALACAGVGQAEPNVRDHDGPEGRLAVMKATAGSYTVGSAEGATRYHLRPEPALRFTNTVGSTLDGGIFTWADEAGRPAAAAQIYCRRDGVWVHEWTTLTSTPILAQTPGAPTWQPSGVGVEFRPVPDAPKPSGTPELRLRQMRELARDFTAEDDFRREGWQPLRLLAKPLARFGSDRPGAEVADGALFAFVVTTDPEVYLMLEVRSDPDGPRWHYGLAPMTIYAVRGSWRGREVWSRPYRRSEATHPDQPFYVRVLPESQ